ncbi:MAG: glycosyltransferase [Aphanothece sp. CMT-3BRIN-NPC111]|jgi:glycosyltransferase involved in cell wall biosynthesis|nr:glycosyltransferase [Aphanothece sp. CMT-3BRIN-NPC111]
MERSLVSVIVAVKNGERYLASALESIFAQDYHPFEVIVVDGGSVDGTQAIAKSFLDVRLIDQTGQGLADAWNTGIDAAKGEFIAFLSSDDLWTSNKLSTQVNFLLRHPEIEYTVARVKFFLEPGHLLPRGFRPELLSGDRVGKIMETLVVRKSLFKSIGNFDPLLFVAEDVDWFSKANDRQIPMAILPNVLLYKRIHDRNISLNSKINNHNLLKIMRKSIHRKRN